MRSHDNRENTATDLQSCCQFQIQIAVQPIVGRSRSIHLHQSHLHQKVRRFCSGFFQISISSQCSESQVDSWYLQILCPCCPCPCRCPCLSCPFPLPPVFLPLLDQQSFVECPIVPQFWQNRDSVPAGLLRHCINVRRLSFRVRSVLPGKGVGFCGRYSCASDVDHFSLETVPLFQPLCVHREVQGPFQLSLLMTASPLTFWKASAVRSYSSMLLRRSLVRSKQDSRRPASASDRILAPVSARL